MLNRSTLRHSTARLIKETSNRRRALTVLAAILLKRLPVPATLLRGVAEAQAQGLPTGPLRWVVPFPPGGGSDLATRVIAKRFGERLGRIVVVENKPGAATAIAAAEVARAKPDGSTLLTAGMSTLTLNPSLYPNLPYAVDRDFTLVSTLVRLPMVLVLSADSAITDLKALITWLAERRETASYASTGAGTPHHVCTALWLENHGLVTTHVPYKGMPQALQDIASGQVSMMFGDVAAATPLIRAGKLRGIAVPNHARVKLLPELPTFLEAGLPFEAAAWQGVVAPRDTAAEIINHYSTILQAVLRETEILTQFSSHGIEALGSSSAEFAQYVLQERRRWSAIIQSKKITVQ
jgi:tripartite-type tricarboxylate transporter receptor subunit TctC